MRGVCTISNFSLLQLNYFDVLILNYYILFIFCRPNHLRGGTLLTLAVGIASECWFYSPYQVC